MRKFTNEEKVVIQNRLEKLQRNIHNGESDKIVDVYNMILLDQWLQQADDNINIQSKEGHS